MSDVKQTIIFRCECCGERLVFGWTVTEGEASGHFADYTKRYAVIYDECKYCKHTTRQTCIGIREEREEQQ